MQRYENLSSLGLSFTPFSRITGKKIIYDIRKVNEYLTDSDKSIFLDLKKSNCVAIILNAKYCPNKYINFLKNKKTLAFSSYNKYCFIFKKGPDLDGFKNHEYFFGKNQIAFSLMKSGLINVFHKDLSHYFKSLVNDLIPPKELSKDELRFFLNAPPRIEPVKKDFYNLIIHFSRCKSEFRIKRKSLVMHKVVHDICKYVRDETINPLEREQIIKFLGFNNNKKSFFNYLLNKYSYKQK